MRMISRLALAASLLLAPFGASAGQIPSYPSAASVDGTEKVLVDKGGTTSTITPAQQSAYTTANGPVATTSSKGLMRQLSGLQTDCLRGDGSSSTCPSGSGAASLHGGYGTGGRWWRMGRFASTTLSPLVNTLVLAPLVVESPTTINAIAARVTTAAASTNIAFAIYNNNSTTGRPSTKILDVPVAVDASTTGFKTLAFTAAQSFPSGVYWVASVANGTPAITAIATGDVNAGAIVGIDSNSVDLLYVSHAYNCGALTYGAAFPADLSGTTCNTSSPAAPLVSFRVP